MFQRIITKGGNETSRTGSFEYLWQKSQRTSGWPHHSGVHPRKCSSLKEWEGMAWLKPLYYIELVVILLISISIVIISVYISQTYSSQYRAMWIFAFGVSITVLFLMFGVLWLRILIEICIEYLPKK